MDAPTVTNGNVTIAWSFDEEVTVECNLQKPTVVVHVACSDSWSGVDLEEGLYTLYIQASDLSHNAAPLVQHSWRVGEYIVLLAIWGNALVCIL